MVQYATPSWYRLSWKAEDVTDEQLEAWRQETKACDEANKRILTEVNEKRKALLEIAEYLYGRNSNVVQYLKRQCGPNRPTFYFSDAEVRVKKAKHNKEMAEFNAKRQEQEGILLAKYVAKAVELGLWRDGMSPKEAVEAVEQKCSAEWAKEHEVDGGKCYCDEADGCRHEHVVGGDVFSGYYEEVERY